MTAYDQIELFGLTETSTDELPIPDDLELQGRAMGGRLRLPNRHHPEHRAHLGGGTDGPCLRHPVPAPGDRHRGGHR